MKPCKLLIVLLLISYCLKGQINAKNASPVLLLASNKNFGMYTGEILRAEGFNEFQAKNLDNRNVTLVFLKKFKIVILAESNVTTDQRAMFGTFVSEGGNLIAFKPPREMTELFGIRYLAGGPAGSEYVSIDTSTNAGRGLIPDPLQLHTDLLPCTLTTGKKIAYGPARNGQPNEMIAVVENNFGKGHTTAFLYNLPENILFTRQGNAKLANEETDGITGIRAMDLFTGGWVDTTKNLFNQADEQMRLLTHCIEQMMSADMPLPRFWYFPDALNCLVTLNNDGEDSKEPEFQPQFEDVYAKGAGMALYIKETELVSRKWVNEWRAKQFEISGHPDDTKQATNPDWNTMFNVYKDITANLNKKYGIPNMRTVVNHWFVWCGVNVNGVKDFTAQAKIEAKHGVRLDCNYAHYDNNSNQGHFLGAMGIGQGNYTGSGLPMKFCDLNGEVLNIYQQLNNVYDQQYMEHTDQDGFFNCFKGLMDRSLENEVYSFINVKAHNNEYFFSKKPLMEMLDYANDRKVPIWTQEKLLDFLKAKDAASFTDIHWSGRTVSFKINLPAAHTSRLTCIIPNYLLRVDRLKVNGVDRPYLTKKIKGYDYTVFTIGSGRNYRIEISYLR